MSRRLLPARPLVLLLLLAACSRPAVAPPPATRPPTATAPPVAAAATSPAVATPTPTAAGTPIPTATATGGAVPAATPAGPSPSLPVGAVVTDTPAVGRAAPTPAPDGTASARLAAPAESGPPPASPTSTPRPLPTAGLAELEAETPARDLVALAERLRHVAPAALPTPGPPADHPVGYHDRFDIADQVNKRYFSVGATVRARTVHAYFYVEDDLEFDAAALQQAAQAFEAQVYPTDVRDFGQPRLPGVDGDRRISIVNAAIPGVGGYFSASDEYPRAVVPYSNQREAIYVNALSVRIGTPAYLSTLAHELQHMIHWNVRPDDDSWMNEGMSVMAQHLNGFPAGEVVPLFLGATDTQLDGWAPDAVAAAPHYGAAYLFLQYLVEHEGGPGILKELLASKAPGLTMIDDILRRRPGNQTLDNVFADWVVANFLNDPAPQNGRYAYQDSSLHAALTAPLTAGARRQDSVHPYAARYYEVPAEALGGTLRFRGAGSVPLMAQSPAAGAEWWSNRADTMDSTLTRPVDLRGLAAAHLQFGLWMDIEEAYDYCYVEASSDGGRSWQTLPGKYSTTTNPNGQNYGNGYTGSSAASAGADPTWVDESIDLSAFAGRQVLLRFEYVTDEAYSGPGVGLRAIRIPEIGYDDDRSVIWSLTTL